MAGVGSANATAAAKSLDPTFAGIAFGKAALRAGHTLLLRVALAELVHATAGVDDLVLARVERVRRRGDIQLDQRIFVAVFPLDLLLAGEGRTGQEREIGGHVLENDFAVFGMDAGLHGNAPIGSRKA